MFFPFRRGATIGTETEVTSGPARLKFNNGFYSWKFDTQHQKTCHTLFTSGGFMAVDRKKFVELGGFNRLFYPGILRRSGYLFSSVASRMALHLRARQPRLASTPSHLVESFQWQLEFA